MEKKNAESAGGMRFSPCRRVRRAREIRELLRRGKRKRTAELDIFWAASAAACARFGVIVPKYGRKIVSRNRLRRRLREIGRCEVLPRLEALPGHWDVLVRARRRSYGAPFQRLKGQLVRCTQQLPTHDANPRRPSKAAGRFAAVS